MIGAVTFESPVCSDLKSDAEFLQALGKRVRNLRDSRGMTRRLLARQAAVSERYLGQLEAGEGNISIMLLRRVAAALSVRLDEMLETDRDAPEERLVRRFLQQLPANRLEETLIRLARELGHGASERNARIALIGLRGAGKSTLGEALARQSGVPFVELDREIEREAGLPLAELFSLYGQAAYRRLERRCLERTIELHSRFVISVGGGVVSETGTYELLRARCFTVWLKASPAEHMERVLAQGDLRPMAASEEAMEDLKHILRAREPLYEQADAQVDTSGLSAESALERLREVVART